MSNTKTSVLSDEDKQAIDTVIEQAKDIRDMGENAIAVQDESAGSLVASTPGIQIQGMEDVPATMLPIPFVKLVQGTSKNIELDNGEDASQGSFYFTDTQKEFKELSFVMLRVKHQITDFEREIDGATKIVPTKQLLILGMTLATHKLFILTLSVMSFSNFGRLIAKFKDLDVTSAWQYEVIATADKKENKKGKFWVANLQVGKFLSSEEIDQMEEAYGQFGGALDREDLQEPDAE